MRTFVVGDIHGAFAALEQVLERSGFRRDVDRLISLGDVCDGWPETRQCIDLLLGLKHVVAVAGNHDLWTRDWILKGVMTAMWEMQGGLATMHSYAGANLETMARHAGFFRGQVPYFLDEGGRLYAHGGYRPGVALDEQTVTDFAWDRKLIGSVMRLHKDGGELPALEYREVYLGHTPLPSYDFGEVPLRMGQVIAMDTGAKNGHRLSMMDVETHEYWQSDRVSDLYPG